MIEQRTIFEIHRLANEGLSLRKIAKQLGLDRGTVANYLRDPLPKRPAFARPSKLDPFKDEIGRLLDIDPHAPATVIQQRLVAKGFTGKLSILRGYLRKTRKRPEALHRILLNAFVFFGGAPKTLVHDNMLTAVIERDGPLICFNDAFLELLRPLKITPRPCNVRQPQEKGKVGKRRHPLHSSQFLAPEDLHRAA